MESGRWKLCLRVLQPPRTLGEGGPITVIKYSERVGLDPEGCVALSP